MDVRVISPGHTCLPTSYSEPSSGSEASCAAVGTWGQGATHHPCAKVPLPHKTFSPHLTPSQPVSRSLSLSVYCRTSFKGSHTCCFPFLHMKLRHPSNSFETVLSTLSSHLLIAKFGLFFTPVFGTADHSSSCDLCGIDLSWFSSYFSGGSF